MSLDIFVQDIPAAAITLGDIPDDFQPRPIGQRDAIVDAIRRVAPEVTFATPDWGTIELDCGSIEINLGVDDPVQSFALHVRGDDRALFVVADILTTLRLRALAPGTESGFFEIDQTSQAFSAWRAFRDQVVERDRH